MSGRITAWTSRGRHPSLIPRGRNRRNLAARKKLPSLFLISRGEFRARRRSSRPREQSDGKTLSCHGGRRACSRLGSCCAPGQSRVYQARARNIRRSISPSRSPSLLPPLFNHGPGPGAASPGVARRPASRGAQRAAVLRRGCWGAAAIAPLGPSFVSGCRATSVFLFQRRR